MIFIIAGQVIFDFLTPMKIFIFLIYKLNLVLHSNKAPGRIYGTEM